MILAVDQGTSSTKATLFGPGGAPVASASVPLGQAHPRPGWVEQDASEILDGVRRVVAEIASGHEVDAVGFSTQRESALVWDRATGEPVGPMLGWQDRRGTARRRVGGACGTGARDLGPAARPDVLRAEAGLAARRGGS